MAPGQPDRIIGRGLSEPPHRGAQPTRNTLTQRVPQRLPRIPANEYSGGMSISGTAGDQRWTLIPRSPKPGLTEKPL